MRYLLVSYCSAAEVIDGPLKTLSLARLGETRDEQETYINLLLPATTAILENTVRRDFKLHENDEVTVDGTDSDVLAIWKDDATLCSPIVEISSISLYGQSLPLDELKINRQLGAIGFQRAPIERLVVRRQLNPQMFIFPRDFQNINLVLTWGYASPPDDVILAQQYITASLAVIAISGAMSAGAKVRRIRDFEVQFAGAGPYHQQITTWAQVADGMLMKYRTGRRHGG